MTFPAFLDEDGTLMHVDSNTGAAVGELLDTGMGEALGMEVPPTVTTAGDLLIATDRTKTAGIDPATGEVLWVNGYGLQLGTTVLTDDSLLIVDSDVHELNLATGGIVGAWDLTHGWEIHALQEGVVSSSMDHIALLDLP